MKPSRSEFITIRGLRTHVRHWGRDGAPNHVHGARLDGRRRFVPVRRRRAGRRLARDRARLARLRPDRARRRRDSYWFPDYLGRPRRHARPLCAGRAGRPARPQHGRQRRHASTPACGPSACAGWSTWKASACRPTAAGAGAAALRASGSTSCAQPAELRSYAELDDGGRAPAARPIRACRTSAPPSWRSTGRAPNGAGRVGDPRRPGAQAARARCCTGSRKCWPAGSAIAAPVLWVEADDTDMWRWMGPKTQARVEIDRRLAQLCRRRART